MAQMVQPQALITRAHLALAMVPAAPLVKPAEQITSKASFRKIADEAAYLVALVHEYQRRGFFDAPSTSPLLDMDFPETLENLAAMLGTRGYMEPYTREDGRYGTWYGDCR